MSKILEGVKEFFRMLAVVTGLPAELLIFKRKTWYEEGRGVFREGGLLITNHFSPLDYMVNLYLVGCRKLYIVIAEFIYRMPGIRGFMCRLGMECFGAVCCDRDRGGLAFVDRCVELLECGKLVQIFPEAHMTSDGKLQPFKTSYLAIALRSGAPIIPVVTDGNYGLFRRVHILVGKRIYPSELCASKTPGREELLAANSEVERRFAALYEELKRKVECDK